MARGKAEAGAAQGTMDSSLLTVLILIKHGSFVGVIATHIIPQLLPHPQPKSPEEGPPACPGERGQIQTKDERSGVACTFSARRSLLLALHAASSARMALHAQPGRRLRSRLQLGKSSAGLEIILRNESDPSASGRNCYYHLLTRYIFHSRRPGGEARRGEGRREG